MEEKEYKMEDEERIPVKPDYEKELTKIIKSSETDEVIRDALDNYHENDIAGVLPNLSKEERRKLYRILGPEQTSEVFAYVEDDIDAYLEEMDNASAAEILNEMDADDAAELLEDLTEEKSDTLQALMDEESRKDIELIQSYEEDEIGSRMTTNYIVIRKGFTVRQAMRTLVEQAAENDNISILFVIDEEEKYYGALDLKDLIIARDYIDLETIITTSFPYVYAKEPISECIERLKDYSEASIPVLDNDNHILGVITSWNIVETVDDEMSEDYAKLAGLIDTEDLNEPLKESIRKRLPWLVVLLFLGLGVSSVVTLFEPVVAQLAIVVSFQSLILDMAGNVGTQSLGVTIRVLIEEGLTVRQELALYWKEVKVGFTNGCILSVVAFVSIGLFLLLLKGKSAPFSFAISGCIGVALIVAMVISSFMGTMIPIALKKLKFDPAIASGPLISTINDLVAVITYYGFVWIFLIGILQLVE